MQLLGCKANRHIPACQCIEHTDIVQSTNAMDCAKGTKLAPMPMTRTVIGMSAAKTTADCATDGQDVADRTSGHARCKETKGHAKGAKRH